MQGKKAESRVFVFKLMNTLNLRFKLTTTVHVEDLIEIKIGLNWKHTKFKGVNNVEGPSRQ